MFSDPTEEGEMRIKFVRSSTIFASEEQQKEIEYELNEIHICSNDIKGYRNYD